MICTKCGKENPAGAAFCGTCGAGIGIPGQRPMPASAPADQLGAQQAPPRAAAGEEPWPSMPVDRVTQGAPTNTLAVISRILAIAGVLCMPVVASVPAAILAIIAIVQIRARPDRSSGMGLAVGGLVVSVIGTLAWPLMLASPMLFGGAHRKAQQTSCLSNTKQIALAVLMYQQDYDERYMPTGAWCDVAMPYIKNAQVFVCPTLRDQRSAYAMNTQCGLRKLADVKAPASTVMVFEYAPGGWNGAGGVSMFSARHETFGNLAFADGHAKSMTLQQVTTQQWTIPRSSGKP